MFEMHCPLQPTFLAYPDLCEMSQIFGDNPGFTVNGVQYYGPAGHTGLDIDTTFDHKYLYYNSTFENGVTHLKYRRVARDPAERDGKIFTVATHAGTLATNFFVSDPQRGYGVTVTSDPMTEENQIVQYQTLHYHLTAPWQSLANWSAAIKVMFKEKRVVPGEIIGVCGNTGQYTTGPHLHFQLQKRWRNGNTWSEWKIIDPMPYMADDNILYHRWLGGGDTHKYFRAGREVTKEEANAFLNSQQSSIV